MKTTTTFTKVNLTTGDMVELRNGKYGTVMLDTPAGNIIRFHTEKDSFSYLDTRYNDDLTHNKHANMDIVKVFRVDEAKTSASKIGDLIANVDKMTADGTVIYSRDSVVEKPKLDELKTGDMLVHRNGKVSTVYKGTTAGDITRFHTEKDSFSYLSRYDNETLTHESKSDYDIVAVYRTKCEDPTIIGDYIGNPGKMLVEDNLVWSESEVVQATWKYKNADGLYKSAIYDDEDDVSSDDDTSCDESTYDEPDDSYDDDADELEELIDEFNELVEDILDRLRD